MLNIKKMYILIDEKGNEIKSFRTRRCATEEADKLSSKMFGAKFEVKSIRT
jgi:hypothetical protein